MFTFIQILAIGVALLVMFKGWKLFQALAGLGLFISGAAVAYSLAGIVGFGDMLRLCVAVIAGLGLSSLASHPLILRWGGVLLNLAIVVWVRSMVLDGGMGETTANSLTAVLAGFAILAPFASIGVICAMLLAVALEIPLSGGIQLWGLVALCVFVAYIRHGRLPAKAVLMSPARFAAAVTGKRHADDMIDVVLAFDTAGELAFFKKAAVQHGWSVKPLDQLNCAIARMPSCRALAFQRLTHAFRLFSVAAPVAVDRADSQFHLPKPPVVSSNLSTGTISLAEINKRMRTGLDGEILPDAHSGAGVHVAVLDTGGEERPEFDEILGEMVSFVPGESPVAGDDSKHGPNCMSIVNAVAGKARISSVKVLSDRGSGSLESIFQGYNWAMTNQVDVINASYGACDCKGASSCMSCAAVERLRKHGILFVAAAGNSGPSPRTIDCPGGSSGAIAVASADRMGRVSSFSSRGPSLNSSNPKPDVIAYGENVLLRTNRNGPNETPMNGTSFSSPAVAGVAAILAGIAKRDHSPERIEPVVREALLDSCRKDNLAEGHRSTDAVGRGMVSAYEAAAMIISEIEEKNPGLGLPIIPLRLAIPTAVILMVLLLRVTVVQSIASLDGLGAEQAVRLVGRVLVENDRLLLDDGTGGAWILPGETMPASAGALLLIEGDLLGHTQGIPEISVTRRLLLHRANAK